MNIFIILFLNATPVPIEKLAYSTKTVEVIGRYKEFFDNHLFLYGSAISFVINNPEDTSLILTLNKKKDNIYIKGTFKNKKTISVDKLFKAPSDVESLLSQSQKVPPESDEFLQLGTKALKKAKKYDDAELNKTAIKLLRKAFKAQKQTTKNSDLTRHLKRIKKMVELIGDKDLAIKEINTLLAGKDNWKEGEAFLKSLGCLEWHNKWFKKDDFMRIQNFIKVDNSWVPARTTLFVKAVELIKKQLKQKIIYRLKTDNYYKLKAKQAELTPGMNREEAVMAWGFPDNVYRIKKDGFLFDQWCYGEEYVYMVNSMVALVPPK